VDFRWCVHATKYICRERQITRNIAIPRSPRVNWVYGISNGDFLRGIVFALLEQNIVVNTSQQERREEDHKCELPAHRRMQRDNTNTTTEEQNKNN